MSPPPSSIIKIKRSSTGGSVPTGLSAGELAINLTDKRLYSSDGGTTFRVGDKELANTNARINLVNSNLTGTNTALRTLIADRLQVANAAATYQTKAVERAALANTNNYIATKVNSTTFNSALANTNSYIGTKVSTTTFNTVLANTNSYIASKVSTTIFNSALANTNVYIATKTNTTTFNSALANTNAFIKTQLANTNSFIKAQLANTNSYIAQKITNAVSTTIQTRNIVPETDIAYDLGSPSKRFRSLYISGSTIVLGTANLTSTGAGTLKVGGQTLVSNAYVTSTYIANSVARPLIFDRYQVANVNTNFFKKTGTVLQTITPNVSFSANVAIQGKLTVYGGVQTYSANNLVISDNFIYLNSGSTYSNPDLGFAGNYNDGTYHHAGFFRDASDNGTWKVFENYSPEPDANTFINTNHATFRLASFAARNIFAANNLIVSGNTTIAGLKANGSFGTSGYVLKTDGSKAYWSPGNFNQYLQVANAAATYTTKAYAAANSYVKSVLANTNLYIATKLNSSTFNLTLANTNSYIATQATRITLVNNNLTSTNTALRTLINDRIQVANVSATYQTKAAARLDLANTNSYISSQGSRVTLVNTNLTGTNTALRTLISDRLQVSNAAATYATKVNPTTSGLLAHTGRATISTNLLVSGNTTLGGTLVANNSTGSAGYYLRTSGSGVYWAPVAGVSTSQYLEVANAVATYAVKASPSTSGFFNHTGRLTVGTNLQVSGNTRITGSTIIDGDLTVEGAVTYISSSTLNVDDSMIKLAANNSTDTVDVGFYGKYTSSGTKYSGLFRDASDGIYKLYTGLQSEPTSTVDTGGTGYGLAQLDVIIDGGTY